MEKNDFTEFKNLVIYRTENNFIRHSSWLQEECQNILQYCSSNLSFLHNYFDDSTKLFLDLYVTKFLNSVKAFFLNSKILLK